MQNAGIDEVTARATNNAEKMDIPNQLPKKRRQKMMEKFSIECLKVYDIIF